MIMSNACLNIRLAERLPRSGRSRRRSVKPSAQPMLVRTQHLPPHITPAQVVCGEIIAAGCSGCRPIWAGALASSAASCLGRSEPCGRIPPESPGQRPAVTAADGSAPRSRLACTTTLTAGTLARGTVSCSQTWTRSAPATGKPTRYHYPSQGFQSGLPDKQRDALIAAHGRDIRSESSSCTIVTPAAAARRGLQLKLRSKRTDDDRRRAPC